MFHRPSSLTVLLRAVRVTGALVVCAAGCSVPAPQPPHAEFILSTADSSFWVSSGRNGVRVRRVPMTLTRYEGRFREVYVADLDRSFDNAILTGERVYVRDLISNDSTLVYEDSGVVRLARRYAREHPNARPLGKNDDDPIQPELSATGETDILDVHGATVLLEHRTTVEQLGGDQSDTTRVAVDLRTGHLSAAQPTSGAPNAHVPTSDDSAFVPELPHTWKRPGYELVAHGDTTDGTASFRLRDDAMRLWPVTTTSAHVRIYWLDTPPVDAATRRALLHAFNGAADYDESVRYVRADARGTTGTTGTTVRVTNVRATAGRDAVRPHVSLTRARSVRTTRRI